MKLKTKKKEIFEILTNKLEKFGDLNLLDFLKVFVRQSEASIRYNVKSKIKIKSPFTLFKTNKETPNMDEKLIKIYNLKDYGCGELLLNPVNFYTVDGNHQYMLKEPYVNTLATLTTSHIL